MTPGTRRRPARAAPGPGVPDRLQRPPDPFNAPEQHVGGERRRKCVERDSLGPGTASDGVRQKREHGLRRGGGRDPGTSQVLVLLDAGHVQLDYVLEWELREPRFRLHAAVVGLEPNVREVEQKADLGRVEETREPG